MISVAYESVTSPAPPASPYGDRRPVSDSGGPMSIAPQVPVRVMRAAVRGLVRPVLGPRLPVGLQRRWLELGIAAGVLQHHFEPARRAGAAASFQLPTTRSGPRPLLTRKSKPG